MSLSRVLRQKIARRIKRFHEKVELQNYWLPLAKQEDEWDALVAHHSRRYEDGGKWVDAVYDAERENVAVYDAELAQDKEMTRKMLAIVDEETRLALEEGQEVIRGRKKAPIRVLKP